TVTRTCLFEPHDAVPQLFLERELVVARHLDAHQQAVEGRDVRPGGIAAALERLDERRSGAGEWIEDATPNRHVSREQDFYQLRDELPEIRMEPVDVLRALAVGQVRLGPRQGEV